MAWQVLAIWAVTIATIVWFVRDERRLKTEAALAQAAQYYAQAPKYRYQVSAPVPAPSARQPVRRTGGLSAAQRKFLDEIAASGRQQTRA